MEQSSHYITICSDSIGDTAEAVVQAVIHQFQNQRVTIRRYGNVRHEDELRRLMEETAQLQGFVAYTLVQPELREMIREEAVRLDLRIVDIMGPMMQAFIDTFDDAPQAVPGCCTSSMRTISGGSRPSNSPLPVMTAVIWVPC